MRNAFIRGLTSLAQADPRVIFLTADLGFKIFDDFRDRFPARFMNVGIAESNMVGVAAGLALGGFRPFVYSIVPFATLRCFEQIRNDVCYNNAAVTVVGVGGGFAYGPNGPTHHALEDIAAMRSLPNMTVVCPCDPIETELALSEIGKHSGPVYLRLGRAGDPVVHRDQPSFRIGKATVMSQGSDCTIISTGGMLNTAMQAAQLLKPGISCKIVNMHTVKPLDSEILRACCRETSILFSVEEHSRIGGLGSAISEWLADHAVRTPIYSFGSRDRFAHAVGSQEYLKEREGLSAAPIAAAIRSRLQLLAAR